MKYVMDTSAILSGKDFSADFELYTSPMIFDELKFGRMKRRLDYLVESGLKVISPGKVTIETVRKCAQKTGDIARVTEADIEILSLAMELNAVLLTDDYSIQNLAAMLNVNYQGIAQEGITKKSKWSFR